MAKGKRRAILPRNYKTKRFIAFPDEDGTYTIGDTQGAGYAIARGFFKSTTLQMLRWLEVGAGKERLKI